MGSQLMKSIRIKSFQDGLKILGTEQVNERAQEGGNGTEEKAQRVGGQRERR